MNTQRYMIISYLPTRKTGLSPRATRPTVLDTAIPRQHPRNAHHENCVSIRHALTLVFTRRWILAPHERAAMSVVSRVERLLIAAMTLMHVLRTSAPNAAFTTTIIVTISSLMPRCAKTDDAQSPPVSESIILPNYEPLFRLKACTNSSSTGYLHTPGQYRQGFSSSRGLPQTRTPSPRACP